MERSIGVSQTAVKLAFTAKVQREILVVGVERHFLFLTKGGFSWRYLFGVDETSGQQCWGSTEEKMSHQCFVHLTMHRTIEKIW